MLLRTLFPIADVPVFAALACCDIVMVIPHTCSHAVMRLMLMLVLAGGISVILLLMLVLVLASYS
jgi:hypothetical protein